MFGVRCLVSSHVCMHAHAVHTLQALQADHMIHEQPYLSHIVMYHAALTEFMSLISTEPKSGAVAVEVSCRAVNTRACAGGWRQSMRHSSVLEPRQRARAQSMHGRRPPLARLKAPLQARAARQAVRRPQHAPTDLHAR